MNKIYIIFVEIIGMFLVLSVLEKGLVIRIVGHLIWKQRRASCLPVMGKLTSGYGLFDYRLCASSLPIMGKFTSGYAKHPMSNSKTAKQWCCIPHYKNEILKINPSLPKLIKWPEFTTKQIGEGNITLGLEIQCYGYDTWVMF